MASPQTKPLVKLIEAVRAGASEMRRISEVTNREFGLSAALRDVLDQLGREGPRTVPDMARAFGVSRQHVQQCVDRLGDRRLVSTRENPAHRRSSLIALTPDGTRLMSEIGRQEKAILERLEADMQGESIDAAASVLNRFSRVLATARRP